MNGKQMNIWGLYHKCDCENEVYYMNLNLTAEGMLPNGLTQHTENEAALSEVYAPPSVMEEVMRHKKRAKRSFDFPCSSVSTLLAQ